VDSKANINLYKKLILMTQIFQSGLVLKKGLFLMLMALLYSMTNQLEAQNCNPDSIPPVAVCAEITTVAIGNDDANDCYGSAGPNNQPGQFGPKQGRGIAWVKAIQLNNGSYDECTTDLLFTVQREPVYPDAILGLNATNGHAPCNDFSPDVPSEFERAVSESDSMKFYAGQIGTSEFIRLRVYQLKPDGNIATHPITGQPLVSSCLAQIEIVDKIKPICISPADVTVSCEQFDPSLVAYGDATITDNGCMDTTLISLNYSQFDTICHKGTIFRTFQAIDCSANSSECSQKIVVNYIQNYHLRLPDDLIVNELSPTGEYGQPAFFMEDCELIGVSFTDVIFNAVPDADLRIERTWSIINWCTFDPLLPFIQIPNPAPNAEVNHPANLPGPIVSASGTPSPWAPTIVKINAIDPTPTDYSTFWNANANGYQYTQTIKLIDTFFIGIQGKVFSDSIETCAYEAGEALLGDWTVKATGLVTNSEVEVLTNANGEYLFVFNGVDTVVEVTLIASGNFGQNCQSSYIVNGVNGNFVTLDIPVHLEQRCALLSVGMGTPRLRRCFNNRYTVQACNPSAEAIADAAVEVTFDEYLHVVSSTIPGVLLAGNTYRYEVGDLDAGECKVFGVDVLVSCDAPLGYTHCSEAKITPIDDCNTFPLWSGADVDVNAVCDGDSVRLKIKNIGTGDMSSLLEYVVVEDIIMRQSGEFQLAAGAEKTISYLADGSTWRLQTEEEVFHPFGGVQAVALEGCGGLHQTGLVNLFPLGSRNPFETTDCQQNIGSFDPNDKQAFPVGFGPNHLLEANTDIEYMIRFQNTGTDTAFNVVVLDTLSSFFKAASTRVLSASHKVEFSMLENGVIRFAFPDILLPDSTTNNAGSNGFVKFRVSQVPDLSDGVIIENSAAIYFDFNDPIITNTTFHTIGYPELSVAVHDPYNTGKGLTVYPNPTHDAAIFKLETSLQDCRFNLKNQLGQPVRQERFSGDNYRFERAGLPAGIYFFELNQGTGFMYSGKIVVK
jgi:hypothetical protein